MQSIVFIGSGPVAAESLRQLLQYFIIEAVITKTSTYAEMAGITESPTYSVSTKSELDELFTNTKFISACAVLIDFGIIVSQNVIDYFPKGIINSHFSLLPEWRGADPITFSILSGQDQTGVSLMLLTAGMDEGPLLAQTIYNIAPNEITTTLTENLVDISSRSLGSILPLWIDDKINPAPQEAQSLYSGEATYSRKLTKADGFINWEKSATQIEREVRAFIEWPKSKAQINGLDVVITSTEVVKQQIEPCGKFWVENKQLFVSCGTDCLEILSLKPAGKKEMPAKAFLTGYSSRLFSDK